METTNKNRKNQKKSHIPFRLNLLFFIVFLLFVALVIRLGYLQIIKSEEFKAEVERTESTVVRGNVPRGEIYDSKLRPLVANEAKDTIMYTRGSNTKTENMAQIAYNLAYLIDIPHSTPLEEDKSDLSIRDLKDYFFATNQDLMEDRISDYTEENEIDQNDFTYSEQVNLINDAEILDYTDHELKAAAIFTKMNSAYALSTVNVKNEHVTQDEIAKVSENMVLLPGVSTGTDWDRIYPQGETMSSIIGAVSSEEQGLPETQLNELLAKGYSRNDRVGTSQLENQYEIVLKGSKSTSRTETDNSGDIISQEELYSGTKGHNLVLTIDMDFQKRMDQIVEDTLRQRFGLNDRVYAVAINPKNGDILGMSGREIDAEGNMVDHTLGIISDSFNVGSSVKGATVLMGHMDGVLTSGNNVIVDAPMTFQGSENISSVFNRSGSVALNEVTALQYSSNVYMAQIALRMGGYYNYRPGQTVPINAQATVEEMRRYYNQFGLGSPTGIDLPYEATGQKGFVSNAGQTMFLSFGNFDTYTLMQLGQYSATIANGGVRYAPRLVSEVRETDPVTGNVGALVQETQPKILNTIDVEPNVMERVQQGMYQVVNGSFGFAPTIFRNAEYTIAGKTGNAEAIYWDKVNQKIGPQVTNLSFVGYAPYDDPEIAIAVLIPYLPIENSGTNHLNMSKRIFDAYFNVGEFVNVEPTSGEIPDEESSHEENESNEDTEEQ